MEDTLSRDLEAAKSQAIISGIKITTRSPATTHSQFTDDTILLSVASVIEARALKEILEDYQSTSQQMINFNKSNISFLNTSPQTQRRIVDIFGCKIMDLPSSYLGIPLFK
ncbi:hypothetical protein KI387_036857, partial [Taxus chinensis]